LTAKQAASLQQQLTDEKARALRAHAGLDLTLQAAPDAQGRVGGDVADVSGDLADKENASMLASRSNSNLREIEEALGRLARDPKRYNVCASCGAYIPFGRMEFMPTTRYCMAHAPGR
jgi:RNA polymerase-binding transcription factor DksA